MTGDALELADPVNPVILLLFKPFFELLAGFFQLELKFMTSAFTGIVEAALEVCFFLLQLVNRALLMALKIPGRLLIDRLALCAVIIDFTQQLFDNFGRRIGTI